MTAPSVRPRARDRSWPPTDARQLAYRLQLRAVSRWPKDRLRPDAQLHDAVRRRIARRRAAAWDESAELEQANALYSLLDGRYAAKASPLPPGPAAPQLPLTSRCSTPSPARC
jgi:hypothetical protein